MLTIYIYNCEQAWEKGPIDNFSYFSVNACKLFAYYCITICMSSLKCLYLCEEVAYLHRIFTQNILCVGKHILVTINAIRPPAVFTQ